LKEFKEHEMTTDLNALNRRVLFAIFGPLGVALIAYGIYLIYRADASTSWPTAPGLITRSEVIPTETDRKRSEVHIEFKYVVEDREHRSNQYRFGADRTASHAHANRIIAKYPLGSPVIVAYNPADPDDAVIEAGDALFGYLFCALGVTLFLLVPILVFYIQVKHQLTSFVFGRL
jgi:Protein of unknown function (DUF3592)